MNSFVYLPVQLLILLLAAPLSDGLIAKLKAFSQKRRGAPVFQMYYDLLKLVKKSTVVSDTSSWIYKITPYIYFGSAVAACLLVPISTAILPAIFPERFFPAMRSCLSRRSRSDGFL